MKLESEVKRMLNGIYGKIRGNEERVREQQEFEQRLKMLDILKKQYADRITWCLNEVPSDRLEDLFRIIDEIFWKVGSRDYTSSLLAHILEKELHERGITT